MLNALQVVFVDECNQMPSHIMSWCRSLFTNPIVTLPTRLFYPAANISLLVEKKRQLQAHWQLNQVSGPVQRDQHFGLEIRRPYQPTSLVCSGIPSYFASNACCRSLRNNSITGLFEGQLNFPRLKYLYVYQCGWSPKMIMYFSNLLGNNITLVQLQTLGNLSSLDYLFGERIDFRVSR